MVVALPVLAQNVDPLKTKVATTDLENFWTAFEAAQTEVWSCMLPGKIHRCGKFLDRSGYGK
jgi:hypothetical protein